MSLMRAFLIVLVLLVCVGVVYGYIFERSEDVIVEPALASGDTIPEPVPQRVKQRSWSSVELNKVRTFGDDGEDLLLYEPVFVKANEQGDVFIYDAGDYSVKRFSQDGTYVLSYGKGTGQGPGEFIQPTDFDVGNNGEVWVADIVTNRITEFDGQGRVAHTFQTRTLPYRVANVGAGRIAISKIVASSESFFEIYQTQGTSLAAFGELIEDQAVNAIALDGWLARDPHGGFVYAGLYAGLLAAYTPQGEMRYFRQTIDAAPFPRLVKSKNAMRVQIEPATPVVGLSVSVSGDEVFVLGRVYVGDETQEVLDVYDRKSGDYIHSVGLSERCFYAFVTENYVYSITEAVVRQWQR